MTQQNQTTYTKDPSNKKLFVSREFEADVEKVWRAWTEPALMDQWWAPKPWRAETKSMDFREGGKWLYAMIGPDGTKAYCIVNYESIKPQKSFIGFDAFCDENGIINNDFPTMHWKVTFNPIEDGTRVDVEITFKSEADLEKILEMGFKEGFAMAHNNLDELLAK
ncbi:MAG: ATPase [Bacteroidetes bacterium]|nr:MAG: ATPase [Bacteroidota bacterium]